MFCYLNESEEIKALLRSLKVPEMFTREYVLKDWQPMCQKTTFDNAVFI
jgi:hypothetical protein